MSPRAQSRIQRRSESIANRGDGVDAAVGSAGVASPQPSARSPSNDTTQLLIDGWDGVRIPSPGSTAWRTLPSGKPSRGSQRWPVRRQAIEEVEDSSINLH